MDSLQLILLENALQEVLYSQALGKSSLWLLGNACLFLLFASLVLFFAVLNYKQRKIFGIEEKGLSRLFLNFFGRFFSSRFFKSGILPVFNKYSFYIELVVCGVLYVFLADILSYTAIFLLVLYGAFRLFLFKRTLKLFKRKPGTVVPVGIYLLFSIFFLILLLLFNALPALIEVSAEKEITRQMQNGRFQE